MVDCVEVKVRNQELCVTFPGGARVCAQWPDSGGPPPLSLSKQLMAQTSAALAPLTPIFDIIAAVLAIKDFAEAVPGIITNPGAVVDAVAALIEKVAKLAALIPQLSVPLMLLGLIDMLLAYMAGVVEELAAIAEQSEKIEQARQMATDQSLQALADSVECADEQLAGQIANLQAGAGPVDDLIEVINVFVGLVPGVDPIPPLGTLPNDPAGALAAIEGMVAALMLIRNTLPL